MNSGLCHFRKLVTIQPLLSAEGTERVRIVRLRKRHRKGEPGVGETLASCSVGFSVHCLVVRWNMRYRGELGSLPFAYVPSRRCCSTPPPANVCLEGNGAAMYSPGEGTGFIFLFYVISAVLTFF